MDANTNDGLKLEAWRNLVKGQVIPTPGMKYCDQPYPVCLQNGAWLCLVTVGTLGENTRGTRNFTAVTISHDQGQTWSPFVPCNAPAYAVPLVTPFGRVYALTPCCFTFSDDGGGTWSEPYDIPVYPEGWQGWSVGMPIATGDLAYLPWARIGLASPPRRTEVYFHRSDNLLTERDPAKLRWELIPRSGKGLKGPDWDQPEHRSEEPHIVSLSDGTLYCVFRTDQAYIAYATSRDAGDTWTVPRALTYHPNGKRRIKHPLACPSLWKCGDDRYLLFVHNHGGTTYEDRNPAWICGGIETTEGEILWSEPEILLYSDDLTYDSGRISYPGFLQQDGRYWIFETQKTITRLHEIPGDFLEGLWRQHEATDVATDGLTLSLPVGVAGPGAVPAPAVAPFRQPWLNLDRRRGFSLDLWLDLDRPVCEQRLLDNRTEHGAGFSLSVTADGGLSLTMNDGQTENRWVSASGALNVGELNHVVVVVDGGPKTIALVANGKLCDGGPNQRYGWGRYSPNLRTVEGADVMRVAPDAVLRGIADGPRPILRALRVYDRALRISEAIGNYRAGLEAKA